MLRCGNGRELFTIMSGLYFVRGIVVTDGSVTIVTEKQEITEQDTALVLTLVQVHTGVPASGVRIMTAQ